MNEWSPTDVLKDAFEKLKADPVGLTLPVFLLVLLNAIPNGVIGGAAGALEALDEGEGGVLLIISGLVRLLGMFVGLLVQAWLTGGATMLFLKAARGEAYALGDIFSGGRFFVPMLIALFLVQLSVWIGTLLCVVPGVIAALGLNMAIPLIVDKNLPAIDALKESWRITDGHKLNLFVFFLLGFVVMMVGMMACCVGYFPAMAIFLTAHMFIYVKLTSGETAAAGPGPAVF